MMESVRTCSYSDAGFADSNGPVDSELRLNRRFAGELYLDVCLIEALWHAKVGVA